MKKFADWFLIFAIVLCVISCSSLVLTYGRNNKQDNSSVGDSNNEIIQIEEEIDWSTVVISCFGDSLTNGGYLGSSGITYPRVLRKELNTFACINYGIGSSTVGVTNNCSCHPDETNAHNAGCLRYDNITKASDIIIVMFGANDCSYTELGSGIDETSINTYYGGLNKLCSGLKENYPNAWVFFMTGFDWPMLANQNSFGIKRSDYFTEPVEQVCEKYEFDVFDTFHDLPFNSNTDLVDGVHVTQDFINNTWVPAIAQYIKANYKPNGK